MNRISFLFLTTMLIATCAYAGSSIYDHKNKNVSNSKGVHSINIHVCSNLECPPVRIVAGECSGEHMSWHWGVCVCDEGYFAKDNTCVINAEQTIDGWSGNETQSCNMGNKQGKCSVCLSIENTVGKKGKNEFWSVSNKLCDKNEFCDTGSCIQIAGTGCVKNSDCIDMTTPNGEDCGTDGCYCNYGNIYSNLDAPTTTGTCLLNNNYYEFFYGDYYEKRIVSATRNDVWSSKNFCESLNMRLMTWNEINSTVSRSRITLNFSEGTHIRKAQEAVYGSTSSGFFTAVGYTEDYALVQIARNPSEKSLTDNLFFFCR